jgi:hypothetical protein
MKLVGRSKHYNRDKSLLRFSNAYGLHIPHDSLLGYIGGDWGIDLVDRMTDIWDRMPEGLS